MTYRHLEKLVVRAEFSKCRKFRYRLTIEAPGHPGDKTICVVMQNPSEADENRADKSVQFLEKLVFNGHYKLFEKVREIIIVNQFAYIQKKDFAGDASHIGPDNDRFIKDAIKRSEIVLIAWGKANKYEKRKQAIYNFLATEAPKLLLETKKHPSRGTYTEFLIPFEVLKSRID